MNDRNVRPQAAAVSARVCRAGDWIAWLSAAALAVIGVLWSGVVPAAEPPPADAAVLSQLRAGGLVIYLRHAATDVTGVPEGAEDLARCETQRNLSAEGRAQAQAIGEALQRLDVPVGAVLSSPFCRCRDTARLAFGRAEVDPDLHFAMDVSPADRERLTAALRRMLSTPPADGHNTVIIAHTANLREAAGLWPKPEGTAYVFRPLSDGRFEVLARMEAQQWTALAAAQ
jgi:broad specificity phosphatase PhoE